MTSTSAPPNLKLKKAHYTSATPVTLADGDYMGAIKFEGYDTNSYNTYYPGIFAVVDGPVSTTSLPGRLILNAGQDTGTDNPLTIARNNGMDGTRLYETLTKGSADSFALRNHGMKAMLPGVFPERAFSAEYMLKDLGYALDLAVAGGVDAKGAANAVELMKRAIARGDGANYWPVIVKTFT